MRLTKLFEAPADQEDINAIRKQLVNQIKSETELNLLKKILKVLKANNVDEKIANALKTDPDASVYVQEMVALIMDTEGTQAEKEHFANNFSKGFINISAILTPNKKIALSDIHQNEMPTDPENENRTDTFVHTIFKIMAGAKAYSPQGIGPGEVALAALSPDIGRIGGSTGAIGDIDVRHNGKIYHVEVKGTSAGTPGRLSDAKIHVMDPDLTANTLKKYGQDGQRVALAPGTGKSSKSIFLVGSDASVVAKVAQNGDDVNVFAREMAQALFSAADSNVQTDAAKLIASNSPELMNFYTKALYDRYYQVKSKSEGEELAGFIFINIPGKTSFFNPNDWDQLISQGAPRSSIIYLTDPQGKRNGDPREYGPAMKF
jgi:hypothetical protein